MKTFPNNLEEFQDLISSSQTIINTRRLGILGVDSNQVQLEVVSVRSDENVTTSYVLVDPQDRKEYHPTMVKPEFFRWIKVNNPFAVLKTPFVARRPVMGRTLLTGSASGRG